MRRARIIIYVSSAALIVVAMIVSDYVPTLLAGEGTQASGA
jgi:hypothetical protein